MFLTASALDSVLLVTGGGGVCPNLNDAARVIRGAIVGAAVDETGRASERL